MVSKRRYQRTVCSISITPCILSSKEPHDTLALLLCWLVTVRTDCAVEVCLKTNSNANPAQIKALVEG